MTASRGSRSFLVRRFGLTGIRVKTKELQKVAERGYHISQMRYISIFAVFLVLISLAWARHIGAGVGARGLDRQILSAPGRRRYFGRRRPIVDCCGEKVYAGFCGAYCEDGNGYCGAIPPWKRAWYCWLRCSYSC